MKNDIGSVTLQKIIDDVSCSRGAPMGRQSYWVRPDNQRVYDRFVPMSSDGAYDIGEAYWGLGPRLRVEYTADMEYVKFYREDNGI